MKKLLLPLIALFGAALAQAQPVQAVIKTYGGFTVGQKFTFTVQEVVSSQSVGSKKVYHNVAIPKGIPKFTKGQKVKFTIGSKGELMGPTADPNPISIPLLNTSTMLNTYAKLPNLKSLSPNSASVSKNSAGKPDGVTLTFYKYRIDGTTVNGLTINQIGYSLK